MVAKIGVNGVGEGVKADKAAADETLWTWSASETWSAFLGCLESEVQKLFG